jgi:ABC-type branched-subunit amino acid transport system substrate-binding protein/serine/threonine protein kinase
MRCPRCGFDGEFVGGGCTRCGYGRNTMSSGPVRLTVQRSSSTSMPLTLHTLMRGDVLRQGRYRLIERLTLPENQQGQGAAWLASDAQLSSRRVVIREVAVPEGSPADKERVVRSIASRLAELGQNPGLPNVIEVFNERDTYYIVLQQPEGESLASLLKQQGGALPEYIVAEYGRQLCEILFVLSSQQPPLVHGSINPSTIIVSPDGRRVSLIHMPLFPPKEAQTGKEKGSSGYLAPEQARGTAEPASDLYALAATLHHAVTGYDPHERMAFFHPPARRLNPAVTPGMEEILAQALRLSSQQRYAHADDMRRDLTNLIESYPIQKEQLTSVTDPLGLNAAQIRARRRDSSSLDIGIFAAIGVLVLLAVLFVTMFQVVNVSNPANVAQQNAKATLVAQQQTAAVNTELALEMQSFQKKGIGVSDGRLVFDTYTGRNDVDLKKKAAQAMQQNNWSSSANYFTSAISADPTDGEAQIYNEDLHILQSGVSYVTIVLGLAVDNSVVDFLLARTEMQGAFLAQREINTGRMLPHGVQLRILIDNSGANAADVTTAAQFIANRVAKTGNADHIIAVVGWPSSSQTINARDIVASVHLPIVSETASSVKLSGSSSDFFRVSPPDNLQGDTLGKYAVQQLQSRTILVMRDPADQYSASLADAFTASVKSLNATAINDPADNFTESATTVAQYEKIVLDARAKNVGTLFLAGLDVDAVRLAHAVGELLRARPNDLLLANFRILCGNAVDTNLLLGQGSDPDATIASTFPQDMQRLTFTAFSHPDEWTFLGYPKNQQPSFFANWVSIFQSSTVAADNAPAPGNDAILTHDAVAVIAKAASYVQGPLTGQAVRDALASLGRGNIPAYQGVSGRILFDPQGNPIDKVIVVLGIKANGNTNSIDLIQVAGQFK